MAIDVAPTLVKAQISAGTATPRANPHTKIADQIQLKLIEIAEPLKNSPDIRY